MTTEQEPTPTTDDDAIRVLVRRLARPHASGGEVIERAAILAAGADSAAVLAWIAAHDGEPESQAPSSAKQGLHSPRVHGHGTQVAAAPQRYVLPPGVLT
jgi:hypothetical protein